MPSALLELGTILWFIKTEVPKKYLGRRRGTWIFELSTFTENSVQSKTRWYSTFHTLFSWLFDETRVNAWTCERCCSKETRTSRHKSIVFFFNYDLCYFAPRQQSFQICFLRSDRLMLIENGATDRNERKMWNCCKTKLHFLDVLLRISTLFFFFQSAYIESF